MSEPHGGHEQTDVHVRPIALFGIGLVVTIVLVLGITYGMLQFLLKRGGESEAPRPEFTIRGRTVEPPVTAGPPYQPDPVREMREFRAREEAVLTSYGWVDRDAQRVRIPIDRAMEILLQRGPGPLRAEPQR